MCGIGTDIRVNATKIIVMYLFRGREDICKGKKCLSVVLLCLLLLQGFYATKPTQSQYNTIGNYYINITQGNY